MHIIYLACLNYVRNIDQFNSMSKSYPEKNLPVTVFLRYSTYSYSF